MKKQLPGRGYWEDTWADEYSLSAENGLKSGNCGFTVDLELLGMLVSYRGLFYDTLFGRLLVESTLLVSFI